MTGLGKYKGRLIVLLDMAKLLDSGAVEKKQQNPANGEARSAAAAKLAVSERREQETNRNSWAHPAYLRSLPKLN